MVRTKEELLESINNLIGDNDSDAALTILEDVADTYDDLSAPPAEDWEAKYNDMKQRYKQRFLSGDSDPDLDPDPDPDPDPEPQTYKELFKED